jgi:hypothetical protein
VVNRGKFSLYGSASPEILRKKAEQENPAPLSLDAIGGFTIE